jgi:hypothetical protein
MVFNPFRRLQSPHNVSSLPFEEASEPADIDGMSVYQNDGGNESVGQPSGEGLLAPIAFTEQSPIREWMSHLQERLNHQVRVRLGYCEALAALFRHLEDLPAHPSGVSMSTFVRPSDKQSFAETLHLVVDAIGLERSVDILESTIRLREVSRDSVGSSGLNDESGNNIGRSNLFPRAPPLTGISQPTTS